MNDHAPVALPCFGIAAMRVLRHLLMASLFFGLACNAWETHSDPAPLKVKVTIVSADDSAKQTIEEIEATRLLGQYRCGNNTSYNLKLVLKQADRFECTWTGCVGVYGTQSGQWSLRKDGLEFTAEKFDGLMTIRPLDHLRVLSLQGHYLLLQERDLQWFKQYGADTYCCLHRHSARQLLQDRMRRRWKTPVKPPDGKPKK